MRTHRSTTAAAFSLIEMLVVIAVIVVVAGFVVGLTTAASDRKNISRAQVERDRLVTLIENYKSKIGVFPPDNTNDPGRNTLLYELAGAIRQDPSTSPDPQYWTIFGSMHPAGNILSSVLFSQFGVEGLLNAYSTNTANDPTEYKRFLKNLKPDQYASIWPDTLSLVVPIDGPSGRPNPWKYLAGEHAVHNKESFDLWVDIKVRGQMRTIGNWKE
jgi:prepilin-type N-terminal cleavage/methylation domain-containing protein